MWYEIIDPAGEPIYSIGAPGDTNEPSGTEEWEKFTLSTDPNVQADKYASSIAPGLYTVHIVGLDAHNTVWVRGRICPDNGCPPPPPPRTCPRTIGYWKNNVRKILIQNKTSGIQETRESLERALDFVALASPIYRHGINVAAPVPIDTIQRLSDQEADAILQKAAGNTMLDRALQQNLATWLNLMSGKLNKTTIITLDWGGDGFEGTVWEALQEAQDIILNHQDDQGLLERAKNIADQINNGLLGEDASESTCSDYAAVMPPDKQPPDKDHKPKAPVPEEPDSVPPVPPITCGSPRVNQYGVENPTNNPFYGIKFEYQSGTEIKNGEYDEFKIVLPADVAASMTSVQMEAKASTDVGIATLECQFNQGLPCGPVMDDNGFFAFYFMGAEDNGDGTMTLTFHVQNMTVHGLSHATIGLPDGVVPSSPTGSYQSEVCP